MPYYVANQKVRCSVEQSLCLEILLLPAKYKESRILMYTYVYLRYVYLCIPKVSIPKVCIPIVCVFFRRIFSNFFDISDEFF